MEIHSYSTVGAGTGFSTTFPIDSTQTSKSLGFKKPHENSLDAITNRWEPEADFAYCLASAMTHLGILAQTLILFSTNEFNYMSLGDELSTGSSAMPHKKNPDVLESIKAKTALVHSSLLSILSISKSNLAGYNKDSQWGKQELMKAISHSLPSLPMMAKVIDALEPNADEMLSSLESATTSLSVAENLTMKHKLQFADSKKAVEKALAKGKGELNPAALNAELKESGIQVSETELAQWQDAKWAVEHTAASGPNPKHVAEKSKALLAELEKMVSA